MHRLEREAQDDPFLMEAIEGYEAAGKDQQANLAELQQRLAKRIAPKKERNIILWRILPIAAALVLMVGIGYWAFTPKPVVKQYADLVKPNKTNKHPETKQPPAVQIATVQKNTPAKQENGSIVKKQSIIPVPHHDEMLASAIAKEDRNKVTYKEDTVDYKASNYKVRENPAVDEILKNIQGMAVGADGNITHQGQQVTKARVNGKDFMGGDVAKATRNLPADIVDKIQIVDDYGDQAAKTGIKSGAPNKVLNITTDTAYKQQLIAANRSDGIATNRSTAKLNEVMIRGTNRQATQAAAQAIPYKADTVDYKASPYNKANSKSLNEVTVIGYGTQKKVSVTGSVATVNAYAKTADTATVQQALSGRIAGLAVKDKSNTRTLTGKIVDKADGSALPGVTVKVNGKQQAVQTSADGKFSIAVPANDATLTIAYIGYNSQQVKINNKEDLKIELVPASKTLAEVAITRPETFKQEQQIDNAPHPLPGWDAYNKYLKENGVIKDGKTATVKLVFTVNTDGAVSNIRVIKDGTDKLNQRAINLIVNGPKWVGASDGKAAEVKLKVKFHR